MARRLGGAPSSRRLAGIAEVVEGDHELHALLLAAGHPGSASDVAWGDIRVALRSEGAGSSAVGVLDLVVEIGERAERIAAVSTCLEGP